MIKDHCFDWTFHGDGDIVLSDVKDTHITSLGQGGGYELFEDIREISCDNNLVADCMNKKGEHLYITIMKNTDVAKYIARIPGNPSSTIFFLK